MKVCNYWVLSMLYLIFPFTLSSQSLSKYQQSISPDFVKALPVLIGWSVKGKLAFAHYQSTLPGYGPASVSLVTVFDAVSDKSVESIGTDTEGKIGNNSYSTFSAFWNREQSAISQLLEKHQIKPGNKFPLKEIDKLYETLGLTLDIEHGEPDDPSLAGLIAARIRVSNREGKKKILFASEGSYSTYKIIGYYTSPYENRVVFVAEISHGGPEQGEISYRLIGCHTKNRFQ